MSKSLYICYFGVREPLVRTQVIQYLRELAKGGIEMHLLTFEPEPIGDSEQNEIRSTLGEIRWQSLPYHRRPSAPATVYDVMNGVRFVAKLIKKHNFDILHCRIHVPVAMAAMARKMSGQNPKILFDIRGFFPEEYTDAGVWPANGWLYRSVKWVERWLMKKSDGFVVLTEKARDVLFPESAETGLDASGRPVAVIPCCVDLDGRFSDIPTRSDAREKLGLQKRFVITHLGALGGLYLTDKIADFLAAAGEKDPATFALILTQSDPGELIAHLKQRGFTDADFLATRVSPADVPGYLAASDAGLSFVKATFATLSRSPTKNAEYLASGVPIIVNDGVGDTTEFTEADNVGVVVREFTAEAYAAALDELKAIMAEGHALNDRCRASARRRFDLETIGGERYRAIYRRLLGRD